MNPYGLRLHAHIADYLQSSFIHDAVQEFQSPAFRSESMRQFELVLVVGIVCAGFLLARKRYVEALWILYFAHSALTSARHIPLYLIVASPIIAVELTSWWNNLFANAPKNSIRSILNALSVDVAVGFRRSTFWLAPGLVLAVAITTAQHWPSDFAKTFPIHMVATHAGANYRVAPIHFRSMGRLHPVQALAPAKGVRRRSERFLRRKDRR